MSNTIMRKRLSLILIAIMIASFATIQLSYADTIVRIPDTNAFIEIINSNKLKVIENGTVSTIEIEELNANLTNIHISDTDGYEKTLSADSSSGIVTSDNGLSIKVSDDISSIASKITASTKAYKAKTKIKKYSYSKIKSMLGSSATVAGVASIILALLTAGGLSVPGMLPTLCTYLGGISGLISQVMKGSSKHGVKVTLKSYMRQSTKNGKVYKYEAWKVSNVSKY